MNHLIRRTDRDGTTRFYRRTVTLELVSLDCPGCGRYVDQPRAGQTTCGSNTCKSKRRRARLAH